MTRFEYTVYFALAHFEANKFWKRRSFMKLCPTCTTNNLDDAIKCERCGHVFGLPKRTYNYPKDIITHAEDHPPSRRAKLAMVLGGTAMLAALLMPFCAPIPGVIAIWLGNRELQSLKKGGYSTTGETYANVGVWGGWISTTIGVLMLLLGATVSLWFYQWVKETFIY